MPNLTKLSGSTHAYELSHEIKVLIATGSSGGSDKPVNLHKLTPDPSFFREERHMLAI